jgi:hypothetical protein
MAQPVEFTLWDGAAFKVTTWTQLKRWAQEVEDFWRPFESAHIASDPINARTYVIDRLNRVKQAVRDGEASGGPVADHIGYVVGQMDDGWGPLHPRSENGRLVVDVFNQFGFEAALFAFAVIRRQAQPGNAQTLDHMRGMLGASFPVFVALEPARKRLAAERSLFQSNLARLSNSVEDAEAERRQQFDALLAQGNAGMVGWARRRGRAWRGAIARWRDQKDAAVASIEATEQAYKELMALKAPVDYWNLKAERHRVAEGQAAGRVRWFFGLATPLMAGMFGFVGWYLLTQVTGAPQPGFYFVASAGLATTAGLMLWIGRLLTKLYLSQHHLRQDAEERAIMTTTYLALTADQAASDPDRAIILNALFRPTSDGIVKEDGGLDPNLASALSRVLAR